MKSKFLWILFIAAFLIRLYKIALIKCIAPDGIAYIGAAADLAKGLGFNAIWPPLYPWCINIFHGFIRNPELSGQVVSVIFGTFTVILVYIMTRSIFSEKLALISTIFCAFHPYLVRYSAEVLTDSLFTFLITSVIFCGWLAIVKKNILMIVLTGLLAGLAYLTKPEGIFLLLIISVWWVAAFGGKWYRRMGNVVFAWSMFILISFPYLHAVKKETGNWRISQKESIVFSIALREEGLTNEFLNVSPVEYMKENPREFFTKTGRDLLKLLGRFPDAYHPLLFLFFIIGLFGGIKSPFYPPFTKGGMGGFKAGKYTLYIFSFLIIFFLGYAIFHPGRRYLVGWVPVTLFISACGVEKLSSWLGKGRYLWLLVSITVIIMLPKALEEVRPNGAQWKEAGLWIRNNSTGKIKVMSEDVRTAFYAAGEYVPWSESEFGKVDYVVTGEEINLLKKAHQVAGKLNPVRGRPADPLRLVEDEARGTATSRHVGTTSNGVNIYYAKI